MKTMQTMKTCVAAGAMVALSGAAQAALVDRGGGMIYDTTRNITWLADMNHAFTSGYAAANAGGAEANEIRMDGRMGWKAAVAWAEQLVVGGFDDWRLPTLNPADTTCSDTFNPGGGLPTQYLGFGCLGGELSGLFVADLGNEPNESVLNQTGDTAAQIANLALFSNVQSLAYWSGTEYVDPGLGVWAFGSNLGFQGVSIQPTLWYAVAVRPGDVTTSVPEPQTLALALLALGATAVARRRRSR